MRVTISGVWNIETKLSESELQNKVDEIKIDLSKRLGSFGTDDVIGELEAINIISLNIYNEWKIYEIEF
ncbi:MAG: hypothetical protein FJW63_08540 [Actinobacteria bacterium]|nr:hypothetical protein [Actinomycetota bacterium]